MFAVTKDIDGYKLIRILSNGQVQRIESFGENHKKAVLEMNRRIINKKFSICLQMK